MIGDWTIAVTATPTPLTVDTRHHRGTVTALLGNAGTVYIGGAGSQSTELEAGDGIDIYGQNLQYTYVTGTPGDSVSVLAFM